MLFASPRGFFSSSFELSNLDRSVGLIELLLSKSYSRITLGSQVFRATFGGMIDKEYTLETLTGEVEASATAPLLAGRFDMRYDGKSYTLKADGGIRNVTYILTDSAGKHMGSLRSEGFFRHKLIMDFPDTIPLAIQAFCAWIVIMAVKRASSVTT